VRLGLHACCGPCLIEPLDELGGVHDVTVFFVNPNVHPLAEYRARLATLEEHASTRGVDVEAALYDPAAWVEAVRGLERDAASRCAACYAMRLDETARRAARKGLEAIATTLTVSPYQDADSIREAGRVAAERHGIEYVDTDFRPRYRSAVERSKELGMYRQRFCGCILSEVEAEESRRAAEERRG
jgi:predicted adenine nucleotide alpha hydrolase (AANH) superfamily ATPase